jgi:peptidoglycan/LPS O-acetylase OafA/YrhL
LRRLGRLARLGYSSRVRTPDRIPRAPERSLRIDGLRAIAAFGVLGIHVGHSSGANVHAAYGAFTSHLNVGVTLFFLISGYLLYRPWALALLRERPAPSLRRYAARRMLRIVPAYWVALTLLALWPGLRGVLGPDWWVYYGFFQSLRLDWSFSGLMPAWSLSVEAHYYALLPLYAAAVARLAAGRSPRARLAAAGLALIAVVGMGFCFELARRNALFWTGSLVAHLLWFAAGMALALARAWHDDAPGALRWLTTRPTLCWGLAVATYAAVCLSGLPRALGSEPYTASQKLAEHVAYAVVSLLVMLPAIYPDPRASLAGRVLDSRALGALGLASYGVFLWHQPLLFEMQRRGLDRLVPDWPFLSLALAIVPVAIACGAVSWLLVERPALRLAPR